MADQKGILPIHVSDEDFGDIIGVFDRKNVGFWLVFAV
jgi:hypothetical protein